MNRLRSMPALGMFVIMALALAACETVNTISQRLSAIEFPSLGGVFEDEAKSVADGSCPPVRVVPELATLTEFSPMAEATDKNLVSKVVIDDLRAECKGIKRGSLTLEVAMTLDGRVGSRARLSPSERPTFVYPYFVALTTTDGKIIAKEIHAASMTYGKNENARRVDESREHVFAFDSSKASEYRILVGFQLTDEQLAYNRAAPSQENAPQVALASAAPHPDSRTAMAQIAPAAGQEKGAQTSAPAAPVPLRKPVRPASENDRQTATDITDAFER